jgi:hypothetical protein
MRQRIRQSIALIRFWEAGNAEGYFADMRERVIAEVEGGASRREGVSANLNCETGPLVLPGAPDLC